MADRSILLFGSTASGKSTQIGELAEYIYKTTKKRTRLYTADPGGCSSIQAHINIGLIEHIDLQGRNPWSFEWATDGLTPAPGGGKWVSDAKEDDSIGLWVFEGITSIGTAMMQDLARQAANGKNIGGGLAIKVEADVEDQRITVGSNNQAHYGIVQNRLTDLVWRSFARPGTVVWTALDRRGVDPETGTQVVGPEAPGKALTSVIPGWFNLVFHLTIKPGQAGKAPIHELHLVSHQDMSTGGMQMAIANARTPRNAKLEKVSIVPASIREALEQVKNLTAADEARLRQELNFSLQ
jgi:hypothetical protein